MIKDKAIEELFNARRPHFEDGDEFMAKLSKRLDAVEMVRRYQERILRRYRLAMVACFLVGIVVGSLSIWWLLSSPAEAPRVGIPVQMGWLVWAVENSRLIVSAGLSMLTFLGLSSIVMNVLDVLEMRRYLKEGSTLPMM